MTETDPTAVDRDVRVPDPEDYAQNRRLKQIHDTRDEARQIFNLGYDKVNDRKDRFEEDDFRELYARAVIDYAIEIEPLLIRSSSNLLEEELPDHEGITIQDMLDANGNLKHIHSRQNSYVDTKTMRWVKRQFDQELARLGVGLDISEEKDPAQI